MILNQKETTLAYRCPSCGGVPTSLVGAFSLSGDLFRLKCSCGGSEMTVEKTKDEKYRLTFPCLLCPKPHSHLLSPQVFFGSDIFIIPCATCGIDLCFIGKEKEVAKAVYKSNEEIALAIGDYQLDKLKAEEKEVFHNPEVLEIVSYVIADLSEDGKIYCSCKDSQGDYDCEIFDDHVTVSCKKCHASLDVDITSTSKAYDFLHAEELRLK